MTVLEDRLKKRSVELFNFHAAARADALHIGEIRVFGEDRGESLRVVAIPRVHEPVDHRPDRPIVVKRVILGESHCREQKDASPRQRHAEILADRARGRFKLVGVAIRE